jgi:hypothetical protein
MAITGSVLIATNGRETPPDSTALAKAIISGVVFGYTKSRVLADSEM